MSALLLTVFLVSQQAKSEGWREFVSKEGGYSVELPGEPTPIDQVVPISSGRARLRGVLVQVGGAAFGVQYHEIPPIPAAQQARYFDGLLDGTLKAKSAKLLGEKAITVGGHPGREWTMERPPPAPGAEPLIETTRVLLAAERLYQLLVVQAKSAPAADGQRFLNSFKLASKPSASAPLEPAPTDWPTFKSGEGRFSIALPGKPRIESRTAKTRDGPKPVVIHHATGDGVVYLVSYFDAEPEDARNPGTLLESTRDESIVLSKGKFLGEKKITLDRSPGREFRAEVPMPDGARAGLMKGRVILVGRRVYEMLAVVPKDRAAAHGKEMDVFFRSFRPTEAP